MICPDCKGEGREEVTYPAAQEWSPDRGTHIREEETRLRTCLRCEGSGELGEDELTEEEAENAKIRVGSAREVKLTKYPKMKHLVIKAVLVFLGVLAGALLYHHYAGGAVKPPDQQGQSCPAPAPDPLSHRQRAWIGALEWCESRGEAAAINPKDRDGTASYGAFQFKPSTFRAYQKIYGLTGEFMDPEAQEAIVEQMIIRGGVDWNNEFPVCVKKLGKPPVIPKSHVDA